MKKIVLVLTLCLCLAIPVMAQNSLPFVPSPAAGPIGPTWSYFSFGGVGVPSGPFTFTSPGLVQVDVTDDFCKGDEFEIFEGATSLGTTSAVTSEYPGCGSAVGAQAAFDSPLWSSGSFLLPTGAHSLDVEPTVSPWGGGGAYIRATVLQIDVVIDIKGGSCPNPLNPKSKGSIPVAILASAYYDLADIDLTTLTLNGVPVLGDGILEDSTEPGDYDPTVCDDCFDADDPANFNCDLIDTTPGDGIPDGILDSYCGDGIPERVVKFDTQLVAATLVGPLDKGECVEMVLEGLMLDGTPIMGIDSMVLSQKIK